MLFRVETTQETSKDIKSLNKKFLELFYFLDQQPNRQTDKADPGIRYRCFKTMARYRTNKDNEIRRRGQIGGRNKERQKINCFICKSYIPHLMYAF